MTDAQAPDYQYAETLRRNGKYADAVEQFARLWQQAPSPSVGWRYAACLRRTGQLQKAQKIAAEALAKYPEDEYIKSQMAWILYEMELRPAHEASDLGRVVHYAKRILELNSDRITLVRVAHVVMKVAKSRKKWNVLLEWADRLTPDDLNNKPMTFDGRRGMSDLETWYVGRARALLELGRFDEARRFAQDGLKALPNEIYLLRTAALALAKSGDLSGGIAEMRRLLTHRRADWYMKAELADLEYKVGNLDEAYRLICDAVSDPRQADEYKLEYFVTLARIALELGKLNVAAAHATWVRMIRSGHGWTIPPEVMQVEKDVLAAFQAANQTRPELPKDIRQLAALCRRYWQEGKREGLQFYRGTIKPYPEGRPFTFIKRDDGGEEVYVAVRDLPKNCGQPGSRVEFTLKKGYDQKRARESLQATDVRCVNE